MKKAKKILTALLSAVLLLNSGTAAAAQQPKAETVVLGGQPFGVKFWSNGVMVVETQAFFSDGRYVCPAEDAGLKAGDVIKKVGDTPVATNEELQRAAFDCGGSSIRFTVERGDKELVKIVTPQKNTVGIYLLGAWVRDSCAGIGTMTFYDPARGYFAALGHGVCDTDTTELMPLGSAEIVQVSIGTLSKSSPGKAGSLSGYFSDKLLGHLTKNTPCGIFGTTNDKSFESGKTLPLMKNDRLHVGKALIYTTLQDDDCAAYEAEITKICNTDAASNENFVIKVTDSNLLKRCGGIVQGMSGSPVVQDGMLAGAITHVFLNSPQEGYGVTAQNMVSNYEN